MVRLRVERAATTVFLVGVVGLVLVVAAFDIVWVHWLSTPPHNNGGVITNLGQAQQRADFVWGAVFLVAGGAMMVHSIRGLVTRRPVLLVHEDGLEVFVGGRADSEFLPWDAIRSLRSGRDHDEPASRHRDVLILEVEGPDRLPLDLWGAEWVDGALHIDAGDWEPDVTEVVVHARLAMDEHHRDRRS